ncbi:hypothetical protein [Methylobacterium gnaphalii]|uniref:hypothetical protein n=1 Tax=Methylobacterium gnaphalii TaxID=1010610 RepID=UPI0011BDB5A4|nr:hypothetical protein [Methylobacterium gnaphalii]
MSNKSSIFTFDRFDYTRMAAKQLPLAVHTRCAPLLGLAFLFLINTIIGLFGVVVPVWIISIGPENIILYQTLLILPVCLYALVIGPPIIWTAMSDAANAAPVLKITELDIKDFRIGLNAQWKDVKSTKRTYSRSGLTGIRLDLRHNIHLKEYSFRVGSPIWPFRRRPTEAYVPLTFLDTSPSTLASTIENLVVDHGGEIQS